MLDTETGEINYPLQNTSLSYLKSENHPGIFCLITPEMNIIEMNFLQAVKLFKAPDTEKAISLHDLHHKQTLAGLEYFKSEKNQENVQTVSRRNLSPAENKAISNINALVKIAPTKQKRMALIRALDIIKKGTFASKGLPKSINDFLFQMQACSKSRKSLLNNYLLPFSTGTTFSPGSEEMPQSEKAHRGIVNPQIVLTQSFS